MTLEEAQYYTLNGIIEELYLCLMKQKDDLYHKQAYAIIHLIPFERPPPVFEIKISDLSEQVKKELDDRWKHTEEIKEILKEAVGRIFENIDCDYFMLSGKRLLRVVLV